MLQDLVVYASAIGFLVMGIATLIRPGQVTDFFRVTNISADMRNEIRAVYGGFGIAMSALLFASFHYETFRDGILLTVAVALLGMAGGRIIGFTIERPVGPHPYIYFGIEVVFGILILVSI